MKKVNFILLFLMIVLSLSSFLMSAEKAMAWDTNTLFYYAGNLPAGSGNINEVLPYRMYVYSQGGDPSWKTTLSVDTTITTGTSDDEMIMIRFEGGLTINNGVTLRLAERKRGLVIYVEGDFTNNGTISMTQRGSCNVTSQAITLLVNRGTTYSLLNGGSGGHGMDVNLGSAYLRGYGGAGGAGTSYSGGAGGGGGAGDGSWPNTWPNGEIGSSIGGAGGNGSGFPMGSLGGGGGGNPPGNSSNKSTPAIDIGPGTNTGTWFDSGANYSYVDRGNPANATGVITEVKIYLEGSGTAKGLKIGTFTPIDSLNVTYHDHDVIGDCTKGSEQTFAVSIAVTAGDLIGFTFSDGPNFYFTSTGGSGFIQKVSDIFSAGNYEMTCPVNAGRMSLYGTAVAGTGVPAASGTGGALVIFVEGDINYGVNGYLCSEGSPAGDGKPGSYAGWGGGGGGSGGGTITVFSLGTITGSPTVRVAGGPAGACGSGGTGCLTIHPQYDNDDSYDGDSGTYRSYNINGLPYVTSSDATDITWTSAILWGTIVDTGIVDSTCDSRGFIWSLYSQLSPGNVTPESSSYTYHSEESGSWSSGAFHYDLSLSVVDTFYWRSWTHNSQGYDYSDEEQSFTTVVPSKIDPVSFTTGSTDVSSSEQLLYGSLTSMGLILDNCQGGPIGYAFTNILCNFQYKVFSSVDNWTDAVETPIIIKNSIGTYTASLTGLTAGTKYQFRSKALAIYPRSYIFPYGAEDQFVLVYGEEQYFLCLPTTSTLSVPIKAQWIYNCYPDGIGSSDNWTSSSSSKWEAINSDWRNPDDNDYISSSTLSALQYFTFDNYLAGTSIDKVTIWVRVKRGDIRDNVELWYKGADNNSVSTGPLCSGTSAEYVDQHKVKGLNPITGLAWTTSDITNMQWGVKVVGGYSTVYVSEMYVIVEPILINGASTLTNVNNVVYLDMDALHDLGYSNNTSGDADWVSGTSGISSAFLPGNFYSWLTVPSMSATYADTPMDSVLNLHISPVYNSSSAEVNHAIPGNLMRFDDEDPYDLYEPHAQDFEVHWRGYVDTTNNGTIIGKEGSYDIVVSSPGFVQAHIFTDNGTYSDNLTAMASVSSGYHYFELQRLFSSLLGAVDTASTSSASPNYFVYNQFVVPEWYISSFVDVFRVKVAGPGNVKVAIYTDNAFSPGVPLSYSGSTQVVAGWNNIPIPSVELVAGTSYWLAVNSSTWNAQFSATGGTGKYVAGNFANGFPNNPTGMTGGTFLMMMQVGKLNPGLIVDGISNGFAVVADPTPVYGVLPSFPIVDNESPLELNGPLVVYFDRCYIKLREVETFNAMQKGIVNNSIVLNWSPNIYPQDYSPGEIVTGLKVFEMWTSGMTIPEGWGGGGGTDNLTPTPGNLNEHFVKPGIIPNLFATGGGGAVPQSTGTTRKLPMHDEIIVPAAAALGITTQWLWMMIMVTLSICCSLLVFTWINSTWFMIATLCFCLFAFSFTGVLPAWIALVTAIVGLASLFFGVRTIG